MLSGHDLIRLLVASDNTVNTVCTAVLKVLLRSHTLVSCHMMDGQALAAQAQKHDSCHRTCVARQADGVASRCTCHRRLLWSRDVSN